MLSLIVLVVVAALIFGGFYYWAQRQGLVTAGQVTGKEAGKRRISALTEVVAYVGAILLLAGGVAAIGQRWDHFPAWGHVAVFAAAAVFFFLVGITVGRVREPAIQRLAGVVWFLSVVGVAGAAGYATHDLIYSPADPATGGVTVLGIGVAVTLYSAALWLVRRRGLQNVALFAGLVIMICGIIAVAVGGHATDWAALAYALALWGFGLAWAGLGWRRYIEPMWVTVPLGAVLALVAPGLAVGSYGWMYGTAILTAAIAMAISVPSRNTVFLGMGAVAMFGYVTSAVVTYFHKSLGVPAALSITGLLIIGLAVVTARLMRAARPSKPTEPGAQGPELAHPSPPTEPAAGKPPGRDLPKAS